jgi:cell division initiation protein
MEYRNDEDSIRTALLNAQRMGDSIVREAKQKAELMLDDARIKAEKIHETARREIGDEELELQRLRQEVSAFKNQMLDIYRRHLSLIDLLPEEEAAPAEQPEVVDEAVAPAAPVEEPIVEAPAVEEIVEESVETEEEPEKTLFEEADTEEEEEPLLESLWQPDESLSDEEEETPDEAPSSRFSDLKFGKDYEVNGPFRRRK